MLSYADSLYSTVVKITWFGISSLFADFVFLRRLRSGEGTVDTFVSLFVRGCFDMLDGVCGLVCM